jgi:phosphate:Na+ symporter
VHVLVNLAGALVWLALLDPLASLVRELAPSATELATPRQLATAHTVFNLANTVVFLVLLDPLVAVTRRLLPDRDAPAAGTGLDPGALGTPVLALELARRELLEIGLRVREMVARSVPAVVDGSRAELDLLADLDDEIDRRHAAVVAYLARTGRGPVSDDQRVEVVGLLEVANELERLADLVETDLVAAGHRRLDDAVRVSDPTRARLQELHGAIREVLDDTLAALGERDADAAERVVSSKAEFRERDRAAEAHLAERLAASGPTRVAAYTFEVELLESLRLVHRLCRRIARAVRRSVIPGEGSGVGPAPEG